MSNVTQKRLRDARRKLQQIKIALESDSDNTDALEAAVTALTHAEVVDVLLNIVGKAEYASQTSVPQDRDAVKLAHAILATGEPEEE